MITSKIIYFTGPPASGKTSLLRSLFHMIDNCVEMISLHTGKIDYDGLKNSITQRPYYTFIIDGVIPDNELFHFLTSELVSNSEATFILASQFPAPSEYQNQILHYYLPAVNGVPVT